MPLDPANETHGIPKVATLWFVCECNRNIPGGLIVHAPAASTETGPLES